jgi:hypothetical protein
MVSPEFAVSELFKLLLLASGLLVAEGLPSGFGAVRRDRLINFKATLAGASAFVDCQRRSLPHIRYGHGGPDKTSNDQPEDRTRHSHLRCCAMGRGCTVVLADTRFRSFADFKLFFNMSVGGIS